MNTVFIETMKEKFANQLTIASYKDHPFIKFPAKNPEFGDLDIYEEYPGEYIVYVGDFTHSHFYGDGYSDDERAGEAAKEIISFLEGLFADRIICYGSHEKGGGFYSVEDEDGADWIGHRTLFFFLKLRQRKPRDLFVWSGIYKITEQTE